MALDIRGHLVSCDGGEANFECGAVGQGEQVACGRGQ